MFPCLRAGKGVRGPRKEGLRVAEGRMERGLTVLLGGRVALSQTPS